MEVQLFLDNKEVVVDSTQEIKITKENPYFTLSDSYTLDITIPLNILQNRQVFGNINRVDTSKSYKEYAGRLLYSGEVIMEGVARVVQSTDVAVKVQLACGVSALKMSSEQEGSYIDVIVQEQEGKHTEILTAYLDVGPMSGQNHQGFGVILQDNSNDVVMNLGSFDGVLSRVSPCTSECPKLLDVARLVASKLGYTLDLSVLPDACSHIFIVSASQGNVAKKLPHWTVKEFFTQFQNFFGCTFVKDGTKGLRLVPLNDFISHPMTTIDAVDDFQVEYSGEDEAQGVMNRNLEFNMENSDTEVIEDEILSEAGSVQEFSSEGSMYNAFASDTADVKMRKLYKVNGETYIGWVVDENQYELRRVAPFNPLKRFEDAESVELKIAPAYIEEDVECEIMYVYDFWAGGSVTQKISVHMPSVSNPFKVSSFYVEPNSEQKPTLQSLVDGSESVAKDNDKSDVMSVVFVDGNFETVTGKMDDNWKNKDYQVRLAFTDYSFKKQLSNNRKKWSFSLNALKGYEFYLGQLHRLTFSCSHKVKYMIKFVSPFIPDPEMIFVVRGKRFACEKIEASIRDGKLDNLMTGYFYEIVS